MSMALNWEVKWPRKVLSFKHKTVREEEIETGSDLDELIFLIKKADEEAEEIEIRLYEYDPTPEFLYDDFGGEPPMSSSERWQSAFNQKQELHK
jgi:hypothetical protein